MLEENEMSCTPPDIRNIATTAIENLLPQKSRHKYECVYETFLKWRAEKNTTSFSENLVLSYFVMLAEKYSSSSLWSYYSMLKSTLIIHHDIHIENYKKLQAFLKRKSEGFIPKKAKTLTSENIKDFIEKATDEKYLATKVAVIMGIMGACRSQELHAMKLEHIKDLDQALLVNIPVTKTKIPRNFTVIGEFYNICKKYISLRPTNIQCSTFFLNFQNNKCTSQRIGINKLAATPKSVATFLNLENPQLYTGHCLRRSSATILVDGGGDITTLKSHGAWKSTSVAEGYIDNNLNNKLQISNTIFKEINRPCTSTPISNVNTSINNNSTTNITKNNCDIDLAKNLPCSFNNCSNFTVNIYNTNDNNNN